MSVEFNDLLVSGYCFWPVNTVEEDRKVTQPIPDICCICKKKKITSVG
jgi:hypothetical protein